MSRPLAAFPIVSTHDPEFVQATLSRELSDLRITSVQNRSGYRFDMNGVHLGRTTLAYNQMSTETELDAGTIENAVVLSFSHGATTSLHVDDEFVGPHRVAIVSPGRRTRIHRCAGSGVLLIRARFEDVEQRLRESIDRPIKSSLCLDRSASTRSGVGLQVRRIVKFLSENDARTGQFLGNAILRASFDDVLLDAILSMPSNYTEALLNGSSLQGAPRLVSRAEEYMAAKAAEPITVADIAAECDCSRATLFDAFRRFREYTPMQFLMDCRLKLARRTLESAPPNETVTSIALCSGFAHLGRFSKYYRERFGESPSDTLRRNRGI